jgi:hypothetical protein
MWKLVVLLALFSSLPVSAQLNVLEQRIESCREVLRRVELLDSVPHASVSSDSVGVVIQGLVRHCGFLNNSLIVEIRRARDRNQINDEVYDEFMGVARRAWSEGPKLLKPPPLLSSRNR